MGVLRFERWCSLAVGRIRFRPDRKEIYEELYAHMEDQYEELTAAGAGEKEAEEAVAEAMGDAMETARQLEKLYRPFWGYALRAARCCLILALLLAIAILPGYLRQLGFYANETEEFFGESLETEWNYNRRVWYAEPEARDKSDGYTFTVTRLAERFFGSKAEPEDARGVLYLEIKVFNPRPWAEKSTALREFSAVDSLGTVYEAADYTGSKPYLAANRVRKGLFTDSWVVILRDYVSQEANWIELRYDKSGRHLRLTVDLGGRREAAQ